MECIVFNPRLSSQIFRQGLSIAAIAVLGLPSTGCDLFDAFRDESSLVHVLTTHHGTPEGGAFPNHGEPGSRTYETDLGWTVHLSDAHLTTSAVSLRNCSGDTLPVEFHYGQFPEDLNEPDLQTKSLGSTEAPAARYCLLAAKYSPYNNIIGKEVGDHQPNTEQIHDFTLYVRGLATKGDQMVPFEIRSDRDVDILIDISTIDDGKPFRITGNETFPPELLLSKTYDRFFDGVDFTSMGPADLEEQVWAVIELETRVAMGAIPYGG